MYILDFDEIKNFCFSKDSVKMKRQPRDWEKVFAKYVSEKELLCKIYNEFSKI